MARGCVPCTIITTGPNELVAPIHDRMPLLLPQEAEDLWLDQETTDIATLRSLLMAYPAEEMQACQVSAVVNSPKNDGPECVEPVRAA